MAFLQTTLLRNFILPFGDVLFGQRMMARLKFLEGAQWWGEEQITAYQNRELSRLVTTAYNEVPFYHDLLNEARTYPEEIKTAADLQRIPVVTKDMLRRNFPHGTTRRTGQRTYEAHTSGSTGKNFIVLEDAFTAGWYRATVLLNLEWTGWRIGIPHLQTGMTIKRSLDRRLKDAVLGCHYMSAFQLDDDHLDQILNELDRFDLKFLWGYPGSLYYLARRALQKGWNKPLNAVASWGSSLYPHYRQVIQAAFSAPIFDTYGCSEGIQIAAQCEQGRYHLHALDAVVEFLDDGGQPVCPGTPGNIVVTRLHPGPMPLIRYAIGDIGIPAGPEHCPCGRGLPLMRSLQGRTGDVLLSPSGNRILAEYICGILEHFPEIDNFQMVQEQDYSVLLKIVPYIPISSEKENQIITALREQGAADLEFSIEIVENIILPPSGKHRYIINMISIE